MDTAGATTAWAGRPRWTLLQTGFGLGLDFLRVWRAWKDDPQRPRMLHFVAVEARPVGAQDLRGAASSPGLRALGDALAAQWWGLLPGVIRLVFEDGQVLFTLCVGEPQEMLRQLSFTADAVLLHGAEPQADPAMWALPTLKGVARLCRRGSAVAASTAAGEVRRHLVQCGFQVEKVEGPAPGQQGLRGHYDPAWEPKGGVIAAVPPPGVCAVIGGGLAGAAAAASLARRGWQVQVLDAAPRPASGASGLPAGLLVPAQSPDDNLLSRLGRSGARATLQQAQALLTEADDWQAGGVLEHRLGDARPAPDLGPEGLVWTREATPQQKLQAGLPAGASAWWHDKAGWIRPAALVQAWLAQPGITWCGNTRVHSLLREGPHWRPVSADGSGLPRADLVVVAAAQGSAALLHNQLTLHPVRGQVSWSYAPPQEMAPFPVNGNGHLLPAVPVDGRLAWLSGSSYGRGETAADVRAEDHTANLERLRVLVPQAAQRLAPRFEAGTVQGWAGVRCVSRDRRPLVGMLQPGLWVSTAMGSRGLTFAALCGELLAARLHGEPLPLDRRLADALDAARQL